MSSTDNHKFKHVLEENRSLKNRLRETEETINAISKGEIDAIIVSKGSDDKVFTLQGGNYAYRIFIEKMSEGAVTLDRSGKVYYCNKRFGEMLRRELHSIIGKSILDLVHDNFKKDFSRLLNDGYSKDSKGEIEFILQDDSVLAANVSISRYQMNNDEELCMVVTDLTERKKAEKELLKANNRLEERVKERTTDLERINQTLRQEITERQKFEDQLEASLKEKEILLREIHHRVKNNLQIIMSLLNLQSSYSQEASSKKVFRESINRIRSMALIHEKLYQTTNMSQINFGNYIFDLVNHLRSTYISSGHSINIEYEVEDFTLNMDPSITLGLIVNEVISNSLKHAFPDTGGTIRVKANAENETIFINISDDGVGLPNDMDIAASDSLGLQLIHSLSQQINAEYNIKNRNGTSFSLTFIRPK